MFHLCPWVLYTADLWLRPPPPLDPRYQARRYAREYQDG